MVTTDGVTDATTSATEGSRRPGDEVGVGCTEGVPGVVDVGVGGSRVAVGEASESQASAPKRRSPSRGRSLVIS
jgi:hypothetical protein